MITARQEALVLASWAQIQPMAAQVAELFYDRLFELDPSLEPLFPQDLSAQGPQLMRALGLAVQGLHDFERILPFLQALGRRHVAYGVRTGHYVTLGRALLWTIEQSLAEAFTPAVKEAWAAVYELLASAMIEPAEAREAVGNQAQRQLAL
jgi:hemoglobin-like flavoprotein